MDEIMGEIMIAACGMGTAEPSPCETPAQCRDGGCARLRARDVGTENAARRAAQTEALNIAESLGFTDQMAEVAYLRGLLDSCVCGAGDEADVTRPRAGVALTSVTTDEVALITDETWREVEATTETAKTIALGVSQNRQGWKPRLHHVEMLLAEFYEVADDDRTGADWTKFGSALTEVRSILGGK